MLLGNSTLASGPLAAQSVDPPISIRAEIAVTATASGGVTRLALPTPAVAAINAPAVNADRCRLHFPIPPNAPTLYYFCAAHSAMGGATSQAIPTTTTYVVTVVDGKFYLNGVKQPTISLAPGSTYTFDQSHSSNASHPLRLSTTSGGTHYGGSVYSPGVSYGYINRGQPGAATVIEIPASANFTATAFASSILYPILATVNLAVTATAIPTRQRPIAATAAATAVTSTAIASRARQVAGTTSSAAITATGNAIKLSFILAQASAAISATASAAYRRHRLAAGQSEIGAAGTASALQIRGATATAEIAVAANAGVMGFLRTTTATASVSISAAGGALYDLKSTSATAAISAATSGAAIRYRLANVTAQLAVTGASIIKADFYAAGAAAISVTPGLVSAGKDKFVSCSAYISATGSANLKRVTNTTGTASVSASSAGAAVRLRLVSATAPTAVTGTASATRALGGEVQISCTASGVGTSSVVRSGAANITSVASTTAIGGVNVDAGGTIAGVLTTTATGGYLWTPLSGGNVETPANIWQNAA